MLMSNHNSFRMLFSIIASIYFIWKIDLFSNFSIGNGQSSPGNQHCANRIGTLAFLPGKVDQGRETFRRVGTSNIFGRLTSIYTCSFILIKVWYSCARRGQVLSPLSSFTTGSFVLFFADVFSTSCAVHKRSRHRQYLCYITRPVSAPSPSHLCTTTVCPSVLGL